MATGFALTAEQRAEMEKLYEQDQGIAPVVEIEVKAETPEPEQKQEKPPETETKPPEVQQAKTETPIDPDKDIRPVPYSRFKEVNQKAAQEKARADELAAKLAAFETAATATPPAKQAERHWLDEILDEKPETNAKPTEEVPEWARQIRTEHEQIQAERAQLMLEREVAKIAKDYPDIPEAVVLSGLAQGQAPEDIANTWDWLGKQYVEKRGFVPASQAAASAANPAANVAPRLPAAKAKMNVDEPPMTAKIGTKEHSEQLRNWLASQR